MINLKSDNELMVLEILRDANKPIGSGNLLGIIEEKGIDLSQASIGRILSSLERNGYLKKNRNKGREITPKGEEAIQTAIQFKEIEKHKKRLDELLSSTVLKNFLAILDARRVIESATVKMAAKNITDKEIRKLEKICENREKHYRKSKSISSDDIDFHTTIAKASGNEVLELLYIVVSKFGQQSKLFEFMRRKAGGEYLSSHREILEALRNRDARTAERRLCKHIELLKNDVEKYCHEVEQCKKE